jgi:predicted PurR-regulated permease PerM
MSAVTLLIVMFIGGAVGGLFGMILCIPVAACIKILFEEFFVPRWSRWAALE